jgi:hypothetical protein
MRHHPVTNGEPADARPDLGHGAGAIHTHHMRKRRGHAEQSTPQIDVAVVEPDRVVANHHLVATWLQRCDIVPLQAVSIAVLAQHDGFHTHPPDRPCFSRGTLRWPYGMTVSGHRQPADRTDHHAVHAVVRGHVVIGHRRCRRADHGRWRVITTIAHARRLTVVCRPITPHAEASQSAPRTVPSVRDRPPVVTAGQ